MAVVGGQEQLPLRYSWVCRILALIFTLFSFAAAGFNKETVTSASFNPISFTIVIHSRMSISTSYSSSFIYFSVANAVVSAYTLASLVFCFIKKVGAGWLQVQLFVADTLAVILLFTGNAAIVVTEDLARNGSSFFGWKKFCHVAKTFCGLILAANVISSLAAALYLRMILRSITVISERAVPGS